LGVTFGFDTSGTGLFSKTQAFISDSTAAARPVFTIKNITTTVQRLYQILNATTGDYLFFDLIMLAGETIIIDTRQRKITSTVRGDLTYTLATGSNFATWKLMPQRTNYLNVFASGAGNSMTVAVQNTHWAIDGGILR
jgi:hypothetical protein